MVPNFIQYLLRREPVIADEARSGQSSTYIIVLDQAHAPAVLLARQAVELKFDEATCSHHAREKIRKIGTVELRELHGHSPTVPAGRTWSR